MKRPCLSCSGPTVESSIWVCPACNLIAYQGEPSGGEMPELSPDLSPHDRSIAEAWVKGFNAGRRAAQVAA